MNEVVYFLECAATDAIKIGRSNNLRSRISSIATGSAYPLTLLGSTPHLKEYEVHHALISVRKLNEWFYNLPAIASFARSLSDYDRETALHELHRLAGYFKNCERCAINKPEYHLTAEVLNMMVCKDCMVEAQRIGVR